MHKYPRSADVHESAVLMFCSISHFSAYCPGLLAITELLPTVMASVLAFSSNASMRAHACFLIYNIARTPGCTAAYLIGCRAVERVVHWAPMISVPAIVADSDVIVDIDTIAACARLGEDCIKIIVKNKGLDKILQSAKYFGSSSLALAAYMAACNALLVLICSGMTGKQ